MKTSVSVLALCAFQTSAFVHPPLSRSFKDSTVYNARPLTSDTYTSTPLTQSTQSRTVRQSPPTPRINKDGQVDRVWEKSRKVMVQGGSLKTYSFPSPDIERVQIVLKSEGRPLDADVELWQGPDNTPHKMRVYVEDGSTRPFSAIVETPRGPNTIAVRNIGNLEFPFTVGVVAESTVSGSVVAMPTDDMISSRTIQGGALRTYSFDPFVQSVQVLLKTDGRPLNARIELLQGPNNNKQVVEVYTEDGYDRPFFLILATPGSGNVVRIVNTAPLEFPLSASVEAYEMGDPSANLEPVIGGDNGVSSKSKPVLRSDSGVSSKSNLDLQWW